MPEGLEALGAEALRDILTFIVSMAAGDDQKFRIIDLREAYTADSRRGLRREDERDETVTLHRFGDVTVAGVPFFVMDPARSLNGANLVALKGGPGSANLSDEFPQARRDSDDRHRREPAFPRRRRRLGVARRRRRGPRHTGDEGHGPLRRRHDARSTCSRTASTSPTRSRRAERAAQRRRRRLHAPRPAALLRAQSRQEGRRCRRSCSRATTPTSCRSRWPSRQAPTLRQAQGGPAQVDASRPAGRPLRRLRAGRLRQPRRGQAEGGRTRRCAAAGNEADRLGAGQDEGPHHRRRQRSQLRAVLRRDRQRDAQRRRLQRELHRGSRSGRGRDRQGRCRRRSASTGSSSTRPSIARRSSISPRPAKGW